MNYGEDLEIKLQKAILAMQEVLEDIYKNDQEKQSYPKVLNLILN